MPTTLKLITPASSTPITLAQAKAHLRLIDTSEDTLLADYINSATDYVQEDTGRQLVTATWRLTADRFPASAYTWREGVPITTELLTDVSFYLERCPVQSITSIKYYDQTGTQQTMSASDYVLDNTSEPARVFPALNKMWPFAQPLPASVQIDFVAGYGTAESGLIPPRLLSAVRLALGNIYENRESVVLGGIPSEMPQSYHACIAPYGVQRMTR
jgi:uncharacterized phiE125 gp8 family phage protein